MHKFLHSALLLVALAAAPAVAATSATPQTPRKVSVLGGESQEFAARFFDPLGRPAVGETVHFMNDACGTFANGALAETVTTDASGFASAVFTARPLGITCRVTATAGISVRWDVITFTLPLVNFRMQLAPPQPRPGEAYRLTVTPMSGAYRLYEADVIARVIDGSASASVSPAAANSGQSGIVEFDVTPDHRVGDYELEVMYRTRTQRLAMNAPAAPWQDMWWVGPAENGWGMSVIQHRDMLFAVIYAYDAEGRPTWYVIPGGQWNPDRTSFSGEVYAPRGSPFTHYAASEFRVGEPVGRATLNIVDGTRLALDFTIRGVAGRKTLTRQNLGPVDTTAVSDYADMWWGGREQNGWGMALLQQYRTIFAVWFTYDAAGAPTWFVMPSGSWSDASTYQGPIYRAAGSAWLGKPYDAGAFRTTDVGTFRFRFSGDTATFDYTIDGRSGTMPLSRQPF
ncbi:MAG TPA: hypothetical protein VFK48_07860 [Usitatibacter sp.]|nr:hypothetical protein [Usitatibacter sp.]